MQLQWRGGSYDDHPQTQDKALITLNVSLKWRLCQCLFLWARKLLRFSSRSMKLLLNTN